MYCLRISNNCESPYVRFWNKLDLHYHWIPFLVVGLLSRNKNKDESRRCVLVLVDLAALAAQATGFVVWPLLDSSNTSLWLIPPALIMVSCGWWENYVSVRSPISTKYANFTINLIIVTNFSFCLGKSTLIVRSFHFSWK